MTRNFHLAGFSMTTVMRLLALFAVIVSIGVCAPPVAHARGKEGPNDERISIGIAGRYRNGRWTMLRHPALEDPGAELHLIDSDGIPVRYSGRLLGSGSTRLFRSNSDYVRLSIVVPETNKAFPETIPLRRDIPPIPFNQNWIVCIGDSMGLESFGENKAIRRAAAIAVSQIDSATQLPTAAEGYDGVNLVTITADAA
ncbi:MAG: hypothetical protein AAFN70_09795, partial [Planctomycetota bacterium]